MSNGETSLTEARVKHLEFIQAAIGRISGHSFGIKGLSVTVAAAVSSFAASEQRAAIMIWGAMPILVLWGLDAWYLRCERMFRAMYDAARGETGETNFKMQPQEYQDRVDSWFFTLWATTVSWVYAPLFLLLILGAIVL